MKIKTNELTGSALDWAVAKCWYGEDYDMSIPLFDDGLIFAPSTNWAHGGPIIEREWIDLHCVNDSLWEAECPATGGLAMQNGPTPLIAAMRCYVYSKLGETVEIPDELAAA